MMPVASVVIPCYQHAHVLPAAIESVLAQTVPVQVIVVLDGEFPDHVPTFPVELQPRLSFVAMTRHAGVAAARNAGIEIACTDYLAFLDADDTIEPTKIERQVAALEAHPEAGWCFCDTRIHDAVRGKTELASERYNYAGIHFDEPLAPYLVHRNFIPVHAPLIRRSVLGDIHFRRGQVEDWAFWLELAEVASCRYVPEVLCTYNAGRNGRNRRAA